MRRTRGISKEVFYSDEPIIKVGCQDIESLRAKVGDTKHKRIRLCTHASIKDDLHEMFIVLSKETYIRPAKHLRRAESLHVIEGCAEAVFFDEMGSIADVVSLGDYSSGLRFYYRISEPVFHTLLIRSNSFIFHEATLGPFRRFETVLAPWAPEEGDIAAIKKFLKQLAFSVGNFTYIKRG